MARMNPLKKYAVGMVAIAAVSGGIGMAQTYIKHSPTPTQQVVQVAPTSQVDPSAEPTVVDAVPAAKVKAIEPPASTASESATAPEAEIVVAEPVQTVSDDAYVEPVESEDDYVWDERQEYEDDHEDWDEGGGYDE